MHSYGREWQPERCEEAHAVLVRVLARMVVSYIKYLTRRAVTRGMTNTRVEAALHEWGELFFTGVQYLDPLRQGVDVGCGSPKSISSNSQRPADMK